MPSAAARTLADLAPLLEALGLRWYVFGAQAVIHYGSPRATADVDVTVELGALASASFVDRLADVGVEARIPFDDAFISRTRVLPMVHRGTGMGVDIVLAGPGPEELFLENALTVDIEGVAIRMAAPTDVVVMKALAGRPKDIDDLVGILRAAPAGLDVGAARALIAELEAMLDQSDLTRVFDDALARARRR